MSDPWFEFSEVQVIYPLIKELSDLRRSTSARIYEANLFISFVTTESTFS